MLKTLIKITLFLMMFLISIILISEIFVSKISNDKIFVEGKDITPKNVGLVLGTSKYIADGRRNLFYIYRIESTKELYKQGVIKKILISGDNSHQNYDEPTMMKEDLVSSGIPEKDIYLDYAGLRTLDSVVRGKQIFGADDIVIISQRFHLQRALTLAYFYNVKAIGYQSKEVPIKVAPRVWLRERFARVKMRLDIAIKKQPKFLGDKIDISD